MEADESLANCNFKEDVKMIEICALGPLHVTATLKRAGLLRGSVVVVTSQAGSCAWYAALPPRRHQAHHFCTQPCTIDPPPPPPPHTHTPARADTSCCVCVYFIYFYFYLGGA